MGTYSVRETVGKIWRMKSALWLYEIILLPRLTYAAVTQDKESEG